MALAGASLVRGGQVSSQKITVKGLHVICKFHKNQLLLSKVIQESLRDRRTDRQTDRQTDRRTDGHTPSCPIARPQNFLTLTHFVREDYVHTIDTMLDKQVPI